MDIAKTLLSEGFVLDEQAQQRIAKYKELRITSYNVCYTKLLRSIIGFFRPKRSKLLGIMVELLGVIHSLYHEIK